MVTTFRPLFADSSNMKHCAVKARKPCPILWSQLRKHACAYSCITFMFACLFVQLVQLTIVVWHCWVQLFMTSKQQV